MGLYRRKKVWWMCYSHEGRYFRVSTETSNKALAQKIYDKTKIEIAEGKYFEFEEGNKRTFTELVEKYERQVFKELKGWKSSQSYLNQLKEFFGPHIVSKIKTPLIDDFKQFRKSQGVKPATINRQLNILKRIFNLARKRWQWIKDVPVIEMESRADIKRLRYLSFEEYNNLLASCDEWLKEIVIVAAFTGLRLGNIIQLKRNQVNLSARTITIDHEEMKNGERLMIPVATIVLEILRAKMKVINLNSPLLFLRKNRPFYNLEIQRGLKKACSQAGITDFRFHDLRHCFATWNREAGTDLDTLADMLGHKDTRMTRRYAHITQGGFLNAIQRLDTVCHNFVTVNEKRKIQTA